MKIKSYLRKDAYFDLQGRVYKALQDEIEKINVYRNCVECLNFKQATEICGLVGKRPPAKIIVSGCELFEDVNEIPF